MAKPLCAIAVSVLAICRATAASAEVLEFDRFSSWTRTAVGDGVSLVSPVYEAGLEWDELVPSWNARLARGQWLMVEVAPVWPEVPPRFYGLGRWAGEGSGERRSQGDQRDQRAEVRTDTLVLREPARRFRLRFEVRGPGAGPEALRHVSCSLSSAARPGDSGTPARRSPAWGTTLEVPALCQLDYAGGNGWCSPTSLTMLLRYWGRRLARPDLQLEVEEVAAGVDDPAWPGTGNWAFNAAFAGSLDGLRGSVVRLGGVGDLERWIEAGIPVAASVAYGVLKSGTAEADDGHLVVVTGFTENGEVMMNDPGSRLTPRRVVGRERFDAAWAVKRRTVYLVHPESSPPPLPPHTPWHRNPSPARD